MKQLFLSILTLLLCVPASAALEPGTWYAITINGKGINVPNGATSNLTQLTLWTQTNVPSQLWLYTVNDDGTASFMEGYMNDYICLPAGSMRDGAGVVMRSEATRRDNGNWLLVPVDEANNTYRLATTGNEYYVGVNEVADDAGVVLRPTDTTDTSLVTWTFTPYDKEVPTEYNTVARDMIFDGFMNQYYHTAPSGHVLGGGGWWGDAEMIETILDTFETTGDKTYQTYVQQLITNFVYRNQSDWSYNEYNDDITWMVLASIRAYKYFSSDTYLNYAKSNYDKMYARALENDGALRWCESSSNRNGSNSCINCPAIVAACYLYEMTGDEDYLTKAKNTYAFQREHLYKSSTGQVYDSGNWNDEGTVFTVGNEWASTYNQGTMLGAATKLYLITGEEEYINDAAKVYNYAYQYLTNSDKIISVCQTATGDLCGFKGILMRYVRLYAQTVGDESPMNWMEKNAWYALQKANSAGVIWSKWLTKTPENFKDGDTDFSNDAFGASTAVSVAFNAHVNRVFFKDAYAELNAALFDDIKFMQLSNTNDDTPDARNTTWANSGYIAFKNVDFGDEAATQALLRLTTASGNASVNIYLDAITDETKIGTVANVTNTWDTYSADIMPTVGTHTVYIVPGGENRIEFRYVTFTHDSDGIERVEATKQSIAAPQGTYNLLGQRLSEPTKGLNIIDGKKVVVLPSSAR